LYFIVFEIISGAKVIYSSQRIKTLDEFTVATAGFYIILSYLKSFDSLIRLVYRSNKKSRFSFEGPGFFYIEAND